MKFKEMERVHFKDHQEMSDFMITSAQDGLYVVAVLYYDDAIKVLRGLLQDPDVVAEALEIAPDMYKGYEKEYYISIDENMYVSAEPAYYKDRYLEADAELTLLEGNVSSEILGSVDFDTCVEVSIGFNDSFAYEEDYFDGCCACCKYCDKGSSNSVLNDLEYIENPKGDKVRATMGVDTFLEYFFG